MRSIIVFALFALAAGMVVPKYVAQMHGGGRYTVAVRRRP